VPLGSQADPEIGAPESLLGNTCSSGEVDTVKRLGLLVGLLALVAAIGLVTAGCRSDGKPIDVSQVTPLPAGFAVDAEVRPDAAMGEAVYLVVTTPEGMDPDEAQKALEEHLVQHGFKPGKKKGAYRGTGGAIAKVHGGREWDSNPPPGAKDLSRWTDPMDLDRVAILTISKFGF